MASLCYWDQTRRHLIIKAPMTLADFHWFIHNYLIRFMDDFTGLVIEVIE